MKHGLRLCTLFATWLWCLAAHGQSAVPTPVCPPLPQALRIAFVAFHGPSDVERRDGLLGSAERYLEDLSRRSFQPGSEFKCPVQVQISVGNYYQVLTWLKSGAVDGAVVSSFFLGCSNSKTSRDLLAR
ncbi:MAG: hypothetical protein WDO69_32485 [Pseudomonadota bacterium]